MELWLHTFAVPGRVAETARWPEQAGFTGLLVADSHSLTAELWVELTLAAVATTRYRLGPGATNPRTRALGVTASAAATLHAESGGRVVLGVARGGSAVHSAGLRAPSVAEFQDDLDELQRLLNGGLQWLAQSDAPKVPVHVAASGPRVLAAAARQAEGVDLTLGADPDRLRDAVERVGDASVGAYLNVAVDDDRARARELVRGSTATFARFQGRTGHYDPARHGRASAPLARGLDDALIDHFAVAGPPEEVAERLAAIADAGVERLIVVPGSLDSDPIALARSNDRFAEAVLRSLVQPRSSGV
ncbi:LLM class flavin-dependent oxidoreductase [Solirubrobacter sp. CPCC 204708]|uniref:LLM class flavin-dependent oxidoreductase n=1 Tax=Solirubrobacter deserti TaxID=2282478 RepID=A0ABT4RS77_9ACTN|nr:LLM class flavin-dependent oxidoreductase [Solirubrobacter deserti]MBE2314349.1 LLM class flavin-dependent oxidoreductase [Solirubrobacter deserti]MDA0141447.1 LLM class flavin-dependent oxidoreductase [Solirubrobacter deserti]